MRADKIWIKRIICTFLIFSLSLTGMPARVKAASGSDNYHYMSNEGGSSAEVSTSDIFNYDDDWFFSNGKSYNQQIATLSAIGAITSAGKYTNKPGEYSHRPDNIIEFLGNMGFTNIETNAYYKQENLPDSAACCVAQKTITKSDDPTKTAKLLAVFPMSANYRQEWVGNFNVGQSGLHAGFKAARDEVLRFLKGYINRHGIVSNNTNKVKFWVAGHSRGSAIANLIGGFLADRAGANSDFRNGYFTENEFHTLGEDIFCYTFATPGTIPTVDSPHAATKENALSVEGKRSGEYAAYDSEGEAFNYSGTDKDDKIDPVPSLGGTGNHTYDCIFNFRPNYDVITLLPPSQWGFTVYGQERSINGYDNDTQKAAIKTRMESMLKDMDRKVYDAYKTNSKLLVVDTKSNGDADQYFYKKLNLSNLSVENDGAYAMSDMMASRIGGLIRWINSRDSFENKQAVFQALFGIYGMAMGYVTDNLQVSSAIAPVLLNYVIYAAERIQTGAESDESAQSRALTQILIGLYEYISGTSGLNPDSITVDELLVKYAEYLVTNPILTMGLDAILPEDMMQSIINETGAYTKFGCIMNLSKDIVSTDSEKSIKAKRIFYHALGAMRPEKKAILYGDLGIDEAGEPDGHNLLKSALTGLIGNLVTDDEGQPITLKAYANNKLSKLVGDLGDKVLTKFRKDYSADYTNKLAGYIDTVKTHPDEVRSALLNLLCNTGNVYNFKEELRNVLSFIMQANKIRFAHYNELYIAWMKAQDPGYAVGDLASGDYNDTQYLHVDSAAPKIRYTLNGTAPDETSPMYDPATGIELQRTGYAETYTVEVMLYDQNDKPTSTPIVIGSYGINGTERYPLTVTPVNGEEIVVTTKNNEDVLGDGTIRYIPLMHTLLLKNASIKRIRYDEDTHPLTIECQGQNRITAGDDFTGITMTKGASLTLSGSGSLEISGQTCVDTSEGPLTIETNTCKFTAEKKALEAESLVLKKSISRLVITGDQRVCAGTGAYTSELAGVKVWDNPEGSGTPEVIPATMDKLSGLIDIKRMEYQEASPTPTPTRRPSGGGGGYQTPSPTPSPTTTPTMAPTVQPSGSSAPGGAVSTPTPTPVATPTPSLAPVETQTPPTVTKNHITYQIPSDAGSGVTITGNTSETSKLVIPATIKTGGVTLPVQKIAQGAFSGNEKLKKTIIGKNITDIGKGAFRDDVNLRTIRIRAKRLKHVGKNAFRGIHPKACFYIKGNKKQFKRVKKLIMKSGVGKNIKFIRVTG